MSICVCVPSTNIKSLNISIKFGVVRLSIDLASETHVSLFTNLLKSRRNCLNRKIIKSISENDHVYRRIPEKQINREIKCCTRGKCSVDYGDELVFDGHSELTFRSIQLLQAG